MADLSIVKIKVRRGTNSDRVRVILDEGELGFTTDHQRLWIGDGNTLGGVNVANKFLGYGNRITFGTAQIGDTVYDLVERNIFALSSMPPSLSGNWVNIGPKTDNTYLYYNSTYKLDIVPDSVDRTKLKVSDVIFQALSATSDRRITVLFDGQSIKLSLTNRLYVDPSVIPLSGFKYAPTGLGLDMSGVKFDNLAVVDGFAEAIIPFEPYTSGVAQNAPYLVNEPPGSTLYYLMLKL